MIVYQDSRGWLFLVREGLRKGYYKGFYNKNADARQDSAGWHGVHVLEYKPREEAEKDLHDYAVKHHMRVVG